MPSVPPHGDGDGASRPFPTPRPLDPEPAVEPEPPRPSAADLLPPADGPSRRARRAEQERERRRQRRRSWPQRVVLSLLVLAVVAASAGAALVGYGLYKYDQVERVAVALTEAPPGEPVNFLVVGSDTRDTLEGSGLDEAGFTGDGAEGSGQRSDTIMVVRVDPAQESLDVISFPRDLWLDISGTDHAQRINTAYAGGPQRLVDTIEDNFDIPIHHYVEVDFAGFADLVGAVGGVPMWFDAPVRDAHSGLRIEQAGCTVLDPAMALALARSRHLEYRTEDGWSVDGTGDLGRITRQQVFLRRAMDQVRTLGIDDAGTLRRLIDVGVENVSIDHELGLSDMIDLGRRFGAVDASALRTHALPVEPFTTSGGAAVLRVVEDEAQPVLNVFRGLPPDTVSPVQVQQVTVLNGTGEDGQATLVSDALEEIGFGVVGVGDVDAEVPLAHTRVRFAPGAASLADLVRRHLTSGADLVVDPALDDGEVVVETGIDFTTIGREPAPEDDQSSAPPSTVPGDGSDAEGWAPPTTGDGSTEDGSTHDGSIERETTERETTTTTGPLGYAPDPESSCA